MIEIQELYKNFGGKEVLKGVNLNIHDGETVVIIGRSGCGKSVLLKHIMSIMEPDNGKILIDGTDLFSLSSREQDQFRLSLGMLFQGSALFDSLSVHENVGFSLVEHTNLPPEVIRAKVAEKLALVGLSGIEKLMPGELSGGMKKRVGLARAICNEPKIILYDEPTTGLDPINADVINDLILRMQERLKVTSIVVTHDMTSAYKVANQIAMLYEGKIIGAGTPDEIKNTTNPIIRQFITGSARGPITDQGNSK
ncbi:MAG TPA: ABC transporter ATP-binding protein [bacterium]|nr:ABC transporter ATP-binding protein [bacterium]